jgi:uncharacterized protein (DUF433 family)
MGQTIELMPRITVNPDQCGGRPCVRGMRIRVTDVLDLLAAGLTADQVVEELPDLELEDVAACLRFASQRLDHPVLAAARARGAGTVVLTKDRDFLDLLRRHAPPPQIVWLTCGNTSNAVLRQLFHLQWPAIMQLLADGEPLVEISGAAG